MSEEPRPRLDPLALTVLGIGAAVALAAAIFVGWELTSQPKVPEPATPERSGLRDAVSEVSRWIEEQRARPPEPPAPKPAAKPAPQPKPAPPVVAAPPPAQAKGLELQDLRPAKEKRDYDASAAEGFSVVGDAAFDPDRLMVLRERLAAKGVAGTNVQVTRLMSLSVSTPRGREEVWRIPGMSRHPHWAICEIAISVDGRSAQGRGVDGFSGDAANFMTHHQRALLSAIDQAIGALPAPKAYAPVATRPEPGHLWRYDVAVEPPLWRNATLTYRTAMQGDALGVTTEFRHAGGQMNFNLGTFAQGHPSHANVRFPGFFFHPAYFRQPLAVGQRFDWEWPWQLPGGQVRAGRVKRYAGELKGWEDMAIGGGTYPAARIETTLDYIEDGRVQASVRETIWYMPAVRQVARVVREGRSPDEGSTRIVAQLVEFR